MLTFVEASLQTILNTYKVTNTTILEKVAVLDTNAEEKKYSTHLEKQQITIVYRELPGMMPSMPVADKIFSANFFVWALESEKKTVKDIISLFVETYNSTLQTTSTSKFKIQLTNLTPLGRADNTGALIYQTWQFGATITVVDEISTIFDRSVSIGGNLINAGKGLLSVFYELVPSYAEYPTGLYESKKLRTIKQRLTFSILDSDDTAVLAVKTMIYNNTTEVAIVFTSTTLTATFTGKVVSASDGINEQGYPILKFIVERG